MYRPRAAQEAPGEARRQARSEAIEDFVLIVVVVFFVHGNLCLAAVEGGARLAALRAA